MKELDLKVEDLPFTDFLSARYGMSVKINAEKLWKYSKEHNLSFFTLSLGAILSATNKVPQLKRRIIDNKVIEYDYLDAVCPLLNEDNGTFNEMKIKNPSKFNNLSQWYNYVEELKENALKEEIDFFNVEMQERDELDIINCSCIPWVDFESISNPIAKGNQIQPLITWGKVNENYEMTVTITVSHIFVFGRDLAYFFEYVQDNFNNFIEYLEK